MIPFNFERLELYHYQSNRKSNISGVLEKDESFKLGTFHQDLSYHSNEALVDLGEGPIGPPSPPFFLYFQNVLRFRFFFQNVNVTLPCITNTPTMLFKSEVFIRGRREGEAEGREGRRAGDLAPSF